MQNYAKHYLDTSALVKLIIYPDIKEDGSDNLYNYRKDNCCFYTTDFCLGESLNVLKLKHFSKKPERKQLNLDGYLICINRIKGMTKPNHTLHIMKTEFHNEDIYNSICEIVKTYNIDYVDASIILLTQSAQIKTLLITADDGMQKAAKALKINVWNCVKSEKPE